LSLNLDEFALLVNAVTGLQHNAGTLERIAWRTLTLERMFNLFAGFTANDDWLPDRFYTEGLEIEGRSMVCDRQAFSQMHTEYYQAMGWDMDGNPREETLEDLKITNCGFLRTCADRSASIRENQRLMITFTNQQ